ncbi:MAG: hypothetical protein R3320_06360 [Nitriliruptorales bacterium]|nr:hypothetical protein [Nitriliruptorales bacterium]
MTDGDHSPTRLRERLRQMDDALIDRFRPLLDRLRQVDGSAVPALQRAARGSIRVLGRPFRAVRRWEDRSWFGVVARHRGVVAFVAVAIATAASAVHFDRYPDILAAEAEARAAAERQTVRVPGTSAGDGQPSLAGGAVEIGPPVGVDLERYITDCHEELAEFGDGEEAIVAVVSFDAYLEPGEVLERLPEDVTVRFAQYRIPAEGEPPLETEVVGGDLAASIDRAIGDALEPIRAEEAEVEKLIESGTVEDEEYLADYERRLSELRSVKNVLETGAPVVFAVVVEGPVGALQQLVDAERVRLVDPAPGETDLDSSAFFGVRPDDTDRATYGRDL